MVILRLSFALFAVFACQSSELEIAINVTVFNRPPDLCEC